MFSAACGTVAPSRWMRASVAAERKETSNVERRTSNRDHNSVSALGGLDALDKDPNQLIGFLQRRLDLGTELQRPGAADQGQPAAGLAELLQADTHLVQEIPPGLRCLRLAMI